MKTLTHTKTNSTQTSTSVMPRFVAVVHLPALPGDPCYNGQQSLQEVYRYALADAHALIDGGVDAIIVENFGSAPFHKGTREDRIPPHQLACITYVCAQIKKMAPQVMLGVNCLRNDAYSALAIAHAVGANFIRVNVHTGAYVTDQGLIEGEAVHTLQYRRSLGAEHIQIWADVLVKHASPLAPTDLYHAAQDCVLRGHADAIIITGAATGAYVDLEQLSQIESLAQKYSFYLGSGVTAKQVENIPRFMQGMIIGTALKTNGQVKAPVNLKQVSQMKRCIDTLYTQN
jgi:uncharacterized protein